MNNLRIIGLLWLLSVPAIAQNEDWFRVASEGAAATGGGGGNNIALVGSNFGGTNSPNNTALITFAMPSSVTSGNTVIVRCSGFWAGTTHTFAAADLTKLSGTATIGTIAMDISSNNVSASIQGQMFCRVPITGSGTMTLEFNPGSTPEFLSIYAAEFSGLNASPVGSVSGKPGSTSTSATTASVDTSGDSTIGLLCYGESDLSTANYTRAISDTLVAKCDTAGTNVSECFQYKIINASPNTMTNSCNASVLWKVIYVHYKSS